MPLSTNKYQANVSEIEQNDNIEGRSTDEACPSEEEESYYAEKDNNIIFGGFVGIKSFCTCCQGAFPSKRLLHKHLKICKIPDRTCPVFSLPLQLPVPLVKSNTLVRDIRTRFGFKG